MIPVAAPAASKARFAVLAFGVALAGVTYLDRVCISVTAKQIMRDLELAELQMSFVFSAFTLAYAIFEIPSGYWGDRIGPRRVLTRIVLWWSAFTALTAARVQLSIAARRAFSVRRRRGRSVAQHGQDVLPLVPGERARHRARNLLHGRASGRRTYASAGLGACWSIFPGARCS